MDDILIPLLAVGLAEMGDKTQLSILLLSSRTQEYARLVLGVMLAFLLADGLAILVGSYIDAVVPVTTVKALSGLVFILFGILILKEKGEEEESEQSLSARGAFLSGFSMIFLSEWGDKTQIASALFATEYDPTHGFGRGHDRPLHPDPDGHISGKIPLPPHRQKANVPCGRRDIPIDWFLFPHICPGIFCLVAGPGSSVIMKPPFSFC